VIGLNFRGREVTGTLSLKVALISFVGAHTIDISVILHMGCADLYQDPQKSATIYIWVPVELCSGYEV